MITNKTTLFSSMLSILNFNRLFIIIFMIWCACSLYSTNVGHGQTPERIEADSFLTGMPDKLQERQTEAIRKAISGESDLLNNVRNARNLAAELPDGVSRTEISKSLTLFRSSHYDNDSIPLLVYFHGGGWVIGSINSCSRYCGSMAEKGIAVLAVDYRLAPEHPFPEGLNDCIEAINFALDNMAEWKCSSISVGGDSSGGNLAIATAMSFPESTFDSLILFYPVTKAYADDSNSWKQFGKGFGLDSELMNAFNNAYTSDSHHPLVSPAEATDSALAKLPPTLLVAAERDILQCQGADFADRLAHLGVKLKYVLISGSVHLFITVAGQPTAFSRSVKESSAFISGHPRQPGK